MANGGFMEEVRMITEAEWRILQKLWKKEPMTITQLTKAFADETGWSKHTIISFLNRMEEKDYVFYQEDGRARQYYTLMDQESAIRQEAGLFLQKITETDRLHVIQILLELSDLSPVQYRELYHHIAKKLS